MHSESQMCGGSVKVGGGKDTNSNWCNDAIKVMYSGEERRCIEWCIGNKENNAIDVDIYKEEKIRGKRHVYLLDLKLGKSLEGRWIKL